MFLMLLMLLKRHEEITHLLLCQNQGTKKVMWTLYQGIVRLSL